MKGLSPDKHLTIEKKCRGSSGTQKSTYSGFTFHLLQLLSRIETLIERLAFKSQLFGIAFKFSVGKSQRGTGAGKELIMVFPELCLFSGALHRLGCKLRRLTENSKVAVDKFDLSRTNVFFIEQGQSCLPEFSAEAALKVRELNECNWSFISSSLRAVLGQICKDLVSFYWLSQSACAKEQSHYQTQRRDPTGINSIHCLPVPETEIKNQLPESGKFLQKKESGNL
jgi:hypothetical protein